jgi:hypothetical protein
MAIKTASGSDLRNSLSSGLVLLNTTSFSAVSSVSLPADTFTSTYANYRILLSLSSIAAGNVEGRLRASGSDDSVATYNHGVFQVSSGNSSSVFAANTSLNRFIITNVNTYSAVANCTLDFFRPKETERTSVIWQSNGGESSISNVYGNFGAGVKAATTSFDSFSFIFNGNTTGRVSAYGYNI